MKLDLKKVNPTPKDKFEAIQFMNTAQQHLIDAIFIMDSALRNNSVEDDLIHEKKMKEFIQKFE